jgi:hypothetical protein
MGRTVSAEGPDTGNRTVSTWAPLGGEECLHDRYHAFCVLGELKVASVIDDSSLRGISRCMIRGDEVAQAAQGAVAAGVDWPPVSQSAGGALPGRFAEMSDDMINGEENRAARRPER